jgi:hypothetical protein
MKNELNEEFWIKKTVQSIVRDAKKDATSVVLTATLADTNGTQILIKGDPDRLEWLKSGQDVSVNIKATTGQSTLVDEGTENVTGEHGPTVKSPSDDDEDWAKLDE